MAKAHAPSEKRSTLFPVQVTVRGAWILMVLAVVWAIAATYVALRDAAVAQITDAALVKAAAIFGAFVLFGSLVWMREAQRRRERQIDAEFELERALTDVRSNRK